MRAPTFAKLIETDDIEKRRGLRCRVDDSYAIWGRQAVEELYFGAKWIAGECAGGPPSPEVQAKLEALFAEYEMAIEAMRVLEATANDLRKGNE